MHIYSRNLAGRSNSNGIFNTNSNTNTNTTDIFGSFSSASPSSPTSNDKLSATDKDRTFVRNRIRNAYMKQLGCLKTNITIDSKDITATTSASTNATKPTKPTKTPPSTTTVSSLASYAVVDKEDTKDITTTNSHNIVLFNQLLDLCVDVEEELILSSAPSKLDYFKR